jgi:hypothetical protein
MMTMIERSNRIAASVFLVLLLVTSSSLYVAEAATADNECEIDATSGECMIIKEQEQEKSSSQESSTCQIFMAPSTIPGAGLGIFTAIDREVGESIGEGDVMVPITDLWYHYQSLLRSDTPDDEQPAIIDPYHHPYLDPTNDYVWYGPELGMQHESAHPFAEKEYVLGYAPGIDAAINCHLALNNVDKTVPIYNVVDLHRSRDPGVG